MTAVTATARRRKLRRAMGDVALGGGVIVALLALWEILPRLGLVNPLFTSSPSQILAAGIELWQSGDLAKDIAASGTTFVTGFALSVVVGVPVGVLLGWFDWANRAFSPLVSPSTPRRASR